MLQISPLFPTALGTVNNSSGIDPNEQQIIKDFSNDIETNHGNLSTVSKDVLSKLPNLHNYILENVKQFLHATVNPENKDLEIYITHSWINYTKKGQHHHLHMHPNSIISGVYYIDTDPMHDVIIFSNPKKTFESIRILPENWNHFNSDEWHVPVLPNMLVMFPSSLYHEVPQVQSERTRVSLAFNTFVRGRIGDPINTDCVVIR
jgi:uncharacterized protein (TIGR02466 family)